MSCDSGEEDFIAALRAFAKDPGARGLCDDAAELKSASSTQIVTHDMMVEGVHWLPEQDPADVAWKLVVANLSDLAAKGAVPQALLLGYMLGDRVWNERFAKGLHEATVRFTVPLLGGDTVSTPAGSARAIGITAIGRPAVVPAPSRADARPGHTLWVTGVMGAALAGFEAMHSGNADGALTQAYRRPEPRLDEGCALAPFAGGMMDVSDGLLLDARRMAEASGTTVAIDTAAVPVCAALADRRMEALIWGDDYELLFTMPHETFPPVAATRIGSVLDRGAHPLLLDGAPPPDDLRLGFTHGSPQS